MIALELQKIRKAKGMSQKQLAEASGLSESCISNIENADQQSSPTLRSITRYATALGADLFIKLREE